MKVFEKDLYFDDFICPEEQEKKLKHLYRKNIRKCCQFANKSGWDGISSEWMNSWDSLEVVLGK